MKKILKTVALTTMLSASLFASSELTKNEVSEIEKMPILLWFSDIEIIKKILSSRGFIDLQRLIISMQIKPTEKTRFIYQKKE